MSGEKIMITALGGVASFRHSRTWGEDVTTLDAENVYAYVSDPMFPNVLRAFEEGIITLNELHDSPGVRIFNLDKLIRFYIHWTDSVSNPDLNPLYSPDDITEEFEQVLFELKDSGDLCTEEVIKAVKSRSLRGDSNDFD
ncbi:MAG: hypothetical protein CBE07_001205 [Pelagibacteraceae bacterium TMED247]|nr:MAG: hypothetical protein CBE07_001205 [Pelagibacteraceae bacterium TMED247]|tara:strand:+ start:6815 stop:7234 length:420 start_codon:yes stop_codon:yes gene_type:complete